MRERREMGTVIISTMVLGRLGDSAADRKQAMLTGLNIAERCREEGRDAVLLATCRLPGFSSSTSRVARDSA
jgi:F0F1-type ATP synthase beta subunit